MKKITTPNKVLVLWISFCFTALTAIAQTPKDTLVAFQYFKKADSLLTARKYKESIALFKKALPIYEKVDAWKRVSNCYSKLGKNLEGSLNYSKALKFYKKSFNLRKKNDPNHLDLAILLSDLGNINYLVSKNEKAIYYHEKALKIHIEHYGHKHKKTANSYKKIGDQYLDLGYFQKALNYFNKSLDFNLLINNEEEIGLLYNLIGITYGDLNQSDKALSFYKKALPFFIKNKSIRGLIGVYNNSGNSFKSQGKFNKALIYYKKSLALVLKHYNINNRFSSIIHMNIGNTYTKLKKYDKALFYLEKSLQGYQSILVGDHYHFIELYDGMGTLYSSKQEYDRAFEYHTKALRIAQNIYDNNIDVAISYSFLGEIKRNKEIYDDALLYFKKGLKILEKKYSNEYIMLSDFCFNIGLTLYKKKEYNSAIDYLDKALIFNSKNQKNYKSINPNNYLKKLLLLKTLNIKAQTLNSLYLATKCNDYLTQSLILYHNCDIVIDNIRESYQNYEDKLLVAKLAKEIHNDALALQILAFKEFKDKKHLMYAWFFSEKSKANALKELLEDSNDKKKSGLPNELLTLEKTLKSNKSFYDSRILKEKTKDSINYLKIRKLEDKLFVNSRKRDSLVQVLEKEYPKYYELKHNKKLISIQEIQSKINDQTTVLEFFVADSISYAFTISKNAFSVKELPIKELDKKIALLNTSVTSENNSDYKKTARQLYKELVLPVKENIVGNELIIIPDGVLWHLNFDLLLTEESVKQNARNWPYLLKDYALSYGSSAHLLFNTTKSNSNEKEQLEECLAFSFSNTESATGTNRISLATLRDTGDDLPGTREEIKSISEIFDGQYYYGSQANEANFKENADRYKIIHLALHGEVDDQDPQNSKLYFNKSKDTIEDNLLYAHELFAFNVPAELTVLSACNTGSGKIVNGEGIMSLGNAFQYAGTKSLLLSNWEVSDKTTPALMKYFYTNLKKGMNKATALQQAKLKYLTTTEAFYTHPFYWGSFYVLGDTSPVSSNNYFNNIYLWGFLALLGFLVMGYFVRKRKVAK